MKGDEPLLVAARTAYSVAELAEVLGLSRRFVETRVAAGDLRTVKLGRRRIVLRADAEAWLRRNRTPPI